MNLKKIKNLRAEITQLEDKIKEIEGSLPAHSTKPKMIQEIESLEEQLASKRKELKEIEQ